MPKVLIHIGYPKTGSTYLQKWFEKNPAMLYKARAIVGFEDAHDLARYAEKTEKLHDYFVLSSEDLSVWKGDYNIIGFASKGYDIQKYNEHLTTILHDTFVSPYILIATRGYESILRSLYSQYVRGGGILNFQELQQKYGEDLSALYDYTWLIELYRKVFGPEKVIVLPYELLQNDPARFTSQLEDKLGINNHFQFTQEKINPSLSPQQIAATRLISKFIFNRLGFLPESWRTGIYGFHIRYLAKTPKPLLVRLLAGFCGADDMTVMPSTLDLCKGKAAILKNEPLFQPYLKEYLLN
jgi:hypothetical protein